MRGKARISAAVIGVLLALGMTVPWPAPAAETPNYFVAASYPASLSGASREGEEWVLAGHSIACEKASLAGTARKEAIFMDLTPTYGGCTAFGFPATVAMNDCYYRLELWPGPIHGGSVELKCPRGKRVTVETEFGLCDVQIPPHQKEASFEASDAPPEIGLSLFVSNLTAELKDVGGFLCPLHHARTVTDGFYSGSVTIGGSSPISVR